MNTEQTDDNLSDISNEQIRKIVKKNGWNLGNVKEMKASKQQKKKDIKNKQKFLMEIGQRKWLGKHGRKFLINFDEKQRKDMKQYFKALDKKNNGSIGIEQLQELLISVGLAESREQVKKLIDSVDQDHSGKIQFDEFLDLIQSEGQGQGQYLINFFKKIISHTLDKDIPQNLSFQLVISNIRRKKMMSALNINDISPQVQKDGIKVLNAYRTMNQKRLIRKIRQQQRNRLVRQMIEKRQQQQ